VKLTLTLSSSSRGKPGDPSSVAVFDEAGGTIGRANDNSLILRHNKVSGKHARVTFRDGNFYIQDTNSTNGTAVNNPSNVLEPHRPHALEDGDRVLIEPYEIEVTVDQQADRLPERDEFGFRGDPLARSAAVESPSEAVAGGEVDPMVLLGRPKRSSSAPRPPRPEPPADGPLEEYFRPPDVGPEVLPRPAGAIEIPVGYDPFAPDSVSFPAPVARPRPSIGPRVDPAPIPTPQQAGAARREAHLDSQAGSDVKQPATPAPRPTRTADLDLLDLLRSAGLPDAAVTPELVRNLGEILSVVVSGLIDVLQSRQRIKEEFRLAQTIVRPADNNPLKVSANVKDALHNLLVKRNAAYLGPVESFADAFDDLRDHQLAMLAGMRVAFEAMLAEFDPDQLQESFDRDLAKVTLPLVPAKLRYWELYRQRRADIMRDPEAAFQHLFGEEFGRAYEEQFRRLKAQRKKSGRRESKAPESD
jgi:type VI secretion system FHA domain protein